ncbi:hypothetical protein [Paraburkholderia dipogonis]|jgi:hypothetical protein|uniref:hypothetical protein n=1 Tax=Paraburkholderia dipogonis TaxID=1211383 RepID=UPI0038BC74AB
METAAEYVRSPSIDSHQCAGAMTGRDGHLRNCNEKSNRVIADGQEFLYSFPAAASGLMDERPAETQGGMP